VLLKFETSPTRIHSSAKLEGCILGRNTKVGAKAELVRNLTQAGYEVDAGGEGFLDSACSVFRYLPAPRSNDS
jgi:hypothetical protein